MLFCRFLISFCRFVLPWFSDCRCYCGYDEIALGLKQTMFVPLFTGFNLIGHNSNPYYLKSYIKPVCYIWPVQTNQQPRIRLWFTAFEPISKICCLQRKLVMILKLK